MSKVSIDLSKVKKIEGYKVDLFSYDEICFDFVMLDGSIITRTEEDADWRELQQELDSLPDFDSELFLKLVCPAFEENRTVLFDVEGID